ncbi:IS110 family transposase, partial [Salmonella enterica subsp. enterica serovar Typhi]|nr:IS110 family transposase [Salmonella enterica subsp. enterica serovar Typhi]
MDAIFAGIDVSKDWLDVHILPSGEAFRVGNNGSGFEALKARLAPLEPERIALEATGGLEMAVVAELHGAGLAVVVVNPAQVRSFAGALGKRAKTDPLDAAVIAAFAAAVRPEIRPMADAETRLL